MQAKEFLDKALYGDGEEEQEQEVQRAAGFRPGDSDSPPPPGSPFVKRVENILQFVPNPPAAMQESMQYVTNLTKNVVENIKVIFLLFSRSKSTYLSERKTVALLCKIPVKFCGCLFAPFLVFGCVSKCQNYS